ncbi:MAG TPA: hypothetical protein VES68_03040 [Candidatus Sulfotelmatobacter sp.]|nr:hypothetical protein [Candidatus Sulfotelmatobacter sp.]
MERPRILGLSYFEAVMHSRHKKITLSSEIRDCFEYFDQHSPKALGDYPTVAIHGIGGITLRKVQQGKGYSVEINGVTKIVGVNSISKDEQIEMVKKIRNITYPYANYVRNKK